MKNLPIILFLIIIASCKFTDSGETDTLRFTDTLKFTDTLRFTDTLKFTDTLRFTDTLSLSESLIKILGIENTTQNIYFIFQNVDSSNLKYIQLKKVKYIKGLETQFFGIINNQ